MVSILVTMKYLQHHANPTKLDYTKVLADLIQWSNVYPLRHAWETDSKKVLHLHVLMVTLDKGREYIRPEALKEIRNKYKISLDVRLLRTKKDSRNVLDYLEKQDLNDYEVEQNSIEREIRISGYEDIFINPKVESGVA